MTLGVTLRPVFRSNDNVVPLISPRSAYLDSGEVMVGFMFSIPLYSDVSFRCSVLALNETCLAHQCPRGRAADLFLLKKGHLVLTLPGGIHRNNHRLVARWLSSRKCGIDITNALQMNDSQISEFVRVGIAL
jgi:hypothetical protein